MPRPAIPLGGDVFSESAADRSQPRILRQAKVRLARWRLLRLAIGRGELNRAEALLQQCRLTIEKQIATTNLPCLGSRGEIAYALARVYRQQQKFVSAQREFEIAIELYGDRASFRSQYSDHYKDHKSDKQFSQHKIATIMALGISWCHYTQGALSTAISANLVPGRLLLSQSGDELNRCYADVIYASAVRARGDEKDALAYSERAVREAREVFLKNGHRHYTSGADLELALIALAQGKTSDAEAWLNQTDNDIKHPRWRTRELIIRSRIFRRKCPSGKPGVRPHDSRLFLGQEAADGGSTDLKLSGRFRIC